MAKKTSTLNVVIVAVIIAAAFMLLTQARDGLPPTPEPTLKLPLGNQINIEGINLKFTGDPAQLAQGRGILLFVDGTSGDFIVGEEKYIDGLQIKVIDVREENGQWILEFTAKKTDQGPPLSTGVLKLGQINMIYLWSPQVFKATVPLTNTGDKDLMFITTYRIYDFETGDLLREQTIDVASILAGESKAFEILNKNRRIGLFGIHILKFEINLKDPKTGDTLGSTTQIIDMSAQPKK